MLCSPFAANESSLAEGHTFGRSAEASAACHAYDFGFNNPQFSDRVLHVTREKGSSGSDAGGTTKPHEVAPLLLSMHVNSLTLAANSEVLRYSSSRLTFDNASSFPVAPGLFPGIPVIHGSVVLCDRFGRTRVLVCGIMTPHNSTVFTSSFPMDMRQQISHRLMLHLLAD